MDRYPQHNCCNTINGNHRHPLDNFPLAMGYVPTQEFKGTCDLTNALQIGTIFPELHQPFIGKRGICR